MVGTAWETPVILGVRSIPVRRLLSLPNQNQQLSQNGNGSVSVAPAAFFLPLPAHSICHVSDRNGWCRLREPCGLHLGWTIAVRCVLVLAHKQKQGRRRLFSFDYQSFLSATDAYYLSSDRNGRCPKGRLGTHEDTQPPSLFFVCWLS